MSRGTFLGFFFHLDRSYCGTERITNLVTWIYKCEGRNVAECVGLQTRAQKRIYLLCYVCSIPSFVSSLLTYFFPFVEKKWEVADQMQYFWLAAAHRICHDENTVFLLGIIHFFQQVRWSLQPNIAIFRKYATQKYGRGESSEREKFDDNLIRNCSLF